MEELARFIMEDLPEWWSDGCDAFTESAEKMLNAGMSEDDIKEILTDLHEAVRNEYGD